MKPKRALILSLCFVVSVWSRAETLRELLRANHVPVASVAPGELDQSVQGSAKSDGNRIVILYSKTEDNKFAGPAHLLRYDVGSGKIIRPELQLAANDICSGSTEEVYFVDEYTLVSTSVSPSAECLLVLDSKLSLQQILYGFGPLKVAASSIVIIENMIHFAPVHPERLQLADLKQGRTTELYPPKGDLLRERLIRENAKLMPSQQICGRRNDPCDPRIFDEDFGSMVSDGKGRFAFLASQSASHATVDGQDPEMVVSQKVLYVYQHQQSGWRYCEREVADDERAALTNALATTFDRAVAECTPHLSVYPDMSTAAYNPFFSRFSNR